MITGTIFDIRRYSIHDGPGIRTGVFFKGCPLHCAWCHNPESISFTAELIFRPNRCILCDDCLGVCPNGAITRQENAILIDRQKCKISGECAAVCAAEALQIAGREMTVDQVMSEVERDRVFYEQSGGGVTFSGGEPLAQPEFLLSLLEACKRVGLRTAVDSSGFAPWTVLDEIRPLVDLFLYDLKFMEDTNHLRWTGVSNETILSNLRQLSELRQPVLVRIPVIPGINDDEENIKQSGAFLAARPSVPRVELLPYHNIAEAKYAGLGVEYNLRTIHAPNQEQMEKCAAILTGFGLQVVP
jgi:pyruvate formate lyase activating enzyme